MDLSISIEYLFGHLCLGSTFAHDEEMRMLASQRETLKKSANDRDSQIMTSSREGSVDQQDGSTVSLLGAASDPEFHALDELERVPKRRRTSLSFLGDHQGEHNMGSPRIGIGVLFPKRKPHLVNRPADVHRGTQAEPIELSDSDPSSQGNEAGEFLLDEMPEPDDIQNALSESQLDPETQVTLSDAAFESQSSHDLNPDTKAMRLRQRKKAYKTAKHPSGIWEIDHGLISSSAHHGEEEVEL